MRKSDMRDDAFTEEGRLARPGPHSIEKLIRYHQVERRVLSCNDPTAEAERIRSTPNSFIP